VAIIPARGGSKGLPGKNVRPLAGKPLIAYSIEGLLKEDLETVFIAREERHECWTMGAHGQLDRVQGREGMSRELRQPLYKEMGGMVTGMRAELVRAGGRRSGGDGFP
jgi:hypothetical protein